MNNLLIFRQLLKVVIKMVIFGNRYIRTELNKKYLNNDFQLIQKKKKKMKSAKKEM